MINKVTLLGYVGGSVECKALTTGKTVVNFSLATSERYKDAAGQAVQNTTWHKCVAWGKVGEIIHMYVSKGDLLYVEGKIQTRSWEDPTTKEKKYSFEINVNEVTLMPKGNKPKENSNQPDNGKPYMADEMAHDAQYLGGADVPF